MISGRRLLPPRNVVLLTMVVTFLILPLRIFAEDVTSTENASALESDEVDGFTKSEASDVQPTVPTRTPEEERAYGAARENSPWEKMFILYNLQIGMPVIGYFSRYETGNTILVSYEAIIGTMFFLDGIGMYSKSFVKNRPLSATLKLLGGLGFLALAYYQQTEVGNAPPDSRFWKGYLAYQLLAIPLELYALTVEY